MRWLTTGAAVLTFVVAVGCDASRGESSAASGCGRDTDCKGDRICDNGRCVNPPSPLATTPSVPPGAATQEAPAFAASVAKVRLLTRPDAVTVSEDGVELCRTPCDVLYKGWDADPATEHTLVFKRTGYQPEVRAITVGDTPLNVTLLAAR